LPSVNTFDQKLSVKHTV